MGTVESNVLKRKSLSLSAVFGLLTILKGAAQAAPALPLQPSTREIAPGADRASRFGCDPTSRRSFIGTSNQSNMMMSFEDEGTVIAISDLGLAKPTTDAPAEAAISISGVFAGTPEFASPEQFAGVGVDIR
jgi:serine/threonine protein kinase